jgi:hypothetical protein
MELTAVQASFGRQKLLYGGGLASALSLVALVLGVVTAQGGQPAGRWQMGEVKDTQVKEGVTTRSIGLKLDQVAVIRSKLYPGDRAALEAFYTVVGPADSLQVKETRIVEFNGTTLVTRERVVTRRNGQYRSEASLPIPPDAAAGAYTVTTIVAPVVGTRGITLEREQTIFVVERAGTAPQPPPAAPQPGPVAPASGEPLKVQLWTAKTDFRIGEKVTFYFQTNRDAYVTLINKGTSGRVSVLLPNPYAPPVMIKGGTRYAVPGPDERYELPISGPPGEELVWAVATLKPIRATALGPGGPDVSVLTRDINVQAAGMPPEEQAQAAVVLKVAE